MSDSIKKRSTELYRASQPGAARSWMDDPRCCTGFPEIGECDQPAKRGLNYCRECLELKRAHAGVPSNGRSSNPWGKRGRPAEMAEDEDFDADE